MKEAEEIDKEEAAERNEMKARMPEVAKGLELPDAGRRFCARLLPGDAGIGGTGPTDLGLNQKSRKGLGHNESAGRSKASLS